MTRTKRTRLIGLALLLTGAALLAVSLLAMSQRLEGHYAEADAPRWSVQPIFDQTFVHAGRKGAVHAAPEAAAPSITIEWGESSVRLPVTGRDDARLPQLLQHQEWLRVLRLAEVKGDQKQLEEGLQSGAIVPRLVVVARAPAPGHDPETWGQARYKDWKYTFLELKADGSIERSEQNYRALANQPHTWEFVAAMNVTPSLHTPAMRASSPMSYPNYGPIRSAIGAMGWTWPVAGLSVLLTSTGLLIVGSTFVAKVSRWE
ncbi:MAG: hypothetical protein EA376_12515 [Phycisphaeraceae bacterium]|nr:MAG: hypothetical protein EA376_12515 [Phycisphaeraceae bacterium]